MPDLQGTNVAAPIRPYNSECTYPTAFAEEIAGGLKYVEKESDLAGITPERRPVGTVASLGIGKFRQWTGSNWQAILQGFELPSLTHAKSEVALRFGDTSIPFKAVTATTAGIMLPSMYARLLGHGKTHLQGGDDPIASTTARADMVPQADKYGKLAPGWFPFASAGSPGVVRLADDGQAPQDEPGLCPVAVRANDSRLAQIATLKNRLDTLTNPIRCVEQLPSQSTASGSTLFCIRGTGVLYMLINNRWQQVGGGLPGSDGKSAFEVAQVQGFEGSIDQWLEGLKGADGLDGIDGEQGKNAYELACSAGYNGTQTQWLESLRGLDGTNGVDGQDGVNGKSVYELALENGFIGPLDSWLQTLRGENGQDGSDGKTAYTLAIEEGFTGTQPEWLTSLQGTPGRDGTNGIDGKSAYEQAQDAGFSGTIQEWFLSLKGEAGQVGINGLSAYEIALNEGFSGSTEDWLASLKGVPGTQGENGESGKSAYALAVEAGFIGTPTEWLASLHGAAGQDGTNGNTGKSAYELALENGFTGDVNIWLASLIGPKGEKGDPGEKGESGDGTLSEAELDAILRSRVSAWLEENLPNILETLLPELLETSFESHVSGYHQWQPM